MTAQAGDTLSSLARRKDALRRELRQVRRSLGPAQRAANARRAAAHLMRLLRARGARHVAIYLSAGAELDTRPLARRLADRGARLYAPRVRPGRRLDFAPLRTPVRRNRHGIAEPPAGPRPPRLDAVIVPLVGFDSSGARLGQGGGYYDRLLARRRGPRPLAIGYAHSAQRVEAVPAASHDVTLRVVVSERGVHWTRKA